MTRTAKNAGTRTNIGTRSSMISAMTLLPCILPPSMKNTEMSASPKKRVLPTQLLQKAATKCPNNINVGPKPPPQVPEKIQYKPRWSEQEYVEGPYEQGAKRKPFWGDGDQCFRVLKWGRMKTNMKKADLPSCGPNGEPIPYADLRMNQVVFVVDASGDGWSVARLLPEIKATITEED